jgi:DNA-directed RNA polymerase specialized sigma24 family protein
MGEPNNEDGSITHWIGALKSGNMSVAQQLWERYYVRLLALARTRLRRLEAAADEEDAALSAFNALCTGAIKGRFPNLQDRNDLWRLLVTLTARKSANQMRREQRQKRGAGRVVLEADLLRRSGESGEGGLDEIIGDEPTPEFAALAAEQYSHLLDCLADETLRQIARWKLEGYTNEEIRERLGCSLRTVANKLELIRKVWLHHGAIEI